MSIPHDVQEFLDGYPGEKDDPTLTANLEFYSNTRRCHPDNCTIDDIHSDWFGDYTSLEHKHGYIQWLFPIREFGMNYASQPLQRHEIEAMKADPAIVERVFKSYQLMLDFYGMRLVSPETGLVDRLPPPNYRTRYNNLIHASHNNLRISRILKCLSELGMERLIAPFLLHVLNEQSEYEELDTRRIRGSMDRWWANCMRNEEERQWVGSLIQKVRNNTEEEYVFSRQVYEKIILHRAKTGKLELPPDGIKEE